MIFFKRFFLILGLSGSLHMLCSEQRERVLPLFFIDEVDVIRIQREAGIDRGGVSVWTKDEWVSLKLWIMVSNYEKIKDLLTRNSVNKQTDSGETLLHAACAYGTKGMMRFLVEAGANFLPNNNGYYPIHKVCVQAKVDYLLGVGVDINQKNKRTGKTLLDYVNVELCEFPPSSYFLPRETKLYQRKLSLLFDYLKTKGARFSSELLLGMTSHAEYKMEKGTKSLPDEFGEYPIHRIIQREYNCYTVDLALGQKWDINQKTVDGKTLLDLCFARMANFHNMLHDPLTLIFYSEQERSEMRKNEERLIEFIAYIQKKGAKTSRELKNLQLVRCIPDFQKQLVVWNSYVQNFLGRCRLIALKSFFDYYRY